MEVQLKMTVEYTRDLTHNYMLIREEAEVMKDTYEMRILMSNRIPGILPVETDRINGETWYRCEITSLRPFSALLVSGRMSAEMLRSIYINLLDTLLTLDDYLLDASRLMLDAEYLWLNWEEKALCVPYVPFYSQEIRKSLIELTESIIMQISRGKQECIVLACSILHELQGKDVQLAEVRRFLETEEEERNRAEEEVCGPVHESAGMDEETMLPLYAMSDGIRAEHEEQTEEDVRKPPRPSGSLRSLLPEKGAVRMALAAAVPAAAVYILLQVQTMYLLSVRETLGAALLTAAGVLFILHIMGRRSRKKKKTNTEEAPLFEEAEREPEREPEFLPDETAGTGQCEEPVMPLYAGPEVTPPSAAAEEADGRTTVLSPAGARRTENGYQLIPEGGHAGLPVIPVKGRELLIGKQKTLVDAVIPEETVSRIHARLFKRNNMYYISDMGSRNGTFVDGRPVVGRDEVPLTEGAHVRIADCEYRFVSASVPYSAD